MESNMLGRIVDIDLLHQIPKYQDNWKIWERQIQLFDVGKMNEERVATAHI